MEWDTFKLEVKKILNIHDDKSYVSKLIDSFEALKESGDNIPFKITAIRAKGFVIKVGGLYGYISFNHMPWQYENINSWPIVFPVIKGRIFFGKTYRFNRDPLSIILNGEIPQFKKPDLTINEEYAGVIIHKTGYGLFIDFGYHFNWDCGSIVGMVHKSHLRLLEAFESLEVGQIFKTFYLGKNERDQHSFGNIDVSEEWLNGQVDELVGKIVPVNVITFHQGKRSYLIDKKFNAELPLSLSIYPKNYMLVKIAMKSLRNGDFIHCEVLDANHINKTLLLKWDFGHEIDQIASRASVDTGLAENQLEKVKSEINSVENLAKKSVVEKLSLIGKNVKVEVIKKTDEFGRTHNKYLVENKYSGKLNVSNDNYRLSIKDKKKIEENIQDGEILSCEVIGVDKNQLRINWKLQDEELRSFMEE